MELDDFKAGRMSPPQLAGWSAKPYRRRRRDPLNALRWGQWLQGLVGAVGCAWIAPFWVTHWDQPALLLSGLCLHLYCVGFIMAAVATWMQIGRIDVAAPVLSQQRALLQLRRTCLLVTLWLGLPWWWLYVPLLIVASAGALWRQAPGVVEIQLLVGALGHLFCWVLYRWSGRPGQQRWRQRLDQIALGEGIRRAERELAALERFEHD